MDTAECKLTALRRYELKKVVPTSEDRRDIDHLFEFVRMILLNELQKVAERATLTRTTTNVTRPSEGTQGNDTVVLVSRFELRDQILAAACADLEEQIQVCIE